jgi:hypothetical protein
MRFEVDFLAVRDGEKIDDAIAVRWGTGKTFSIRIVDWTSARFSPQHVE